MTKKITLMFMLLLGIASIMVSCKKKGCTDPAAENYCAECKKDDGSCQYAAVASVQDYVGSWSVTGACAAPYTLTITASGSTLTLTNLYKCFTVTASVSGNSLTIPTQTLNSSATTGSCGYPWTVNGSGTISGTNFNTLQLTYTVKDISGTPTNCSNTCSK